MKSRNPRYQLQRATPFAIAGVLALASTLLPPGPRHPMWLLVAVGLATAVTISGLVEFGEPAAAWVSLVRLVLAVTTITVVAYAAGPASGLSALLLLPVIFSALYGKPVEAAVLIPAVAVADTFIWTQGTSTPAALVRSLLVYTGVALLVTIATHGLRSRLSSALGAADERSRQLAVMANAAQALNSLDPDEVIATASHLAAILVSPHGATPRRGQYFALEGERMMIAADSDEAGISIAGEGWPIGEHPGAVELLRTGRAFGGPIDLAACGPDVRRLLFLSGVTHAAYALVRVDGRARGILSASSRGRPIADDLVERLGSLAHLTELALANALSHQAFQRQATVDSLTNLCNRRGFDLALSRISGREPFAIFAIDVDGLKAVNDRWGHAEGDRLIAAVGAALAAVVRAGDTLSRVGGDEFALLTINASDQTIAQLEIRMHAAVSNLQLASSAPTISIGAALGNGNEQPYKVHERADHAMYLAKHRVHTAQITSGTGALPEASREAVLSAGDAHSIRGTFESGA